jgi:hypothetical protein
MVQTITQENGGPPPGFEPRSGDWQSNKLSTTPGGSRVPQNKFFVTIYSLCGLRNEIDWGMARHQHRFHTVFEVFGSVRVNYPKDMKSI